MKRQSKKIRLIIAFVFSILVLLVTPLSVSAYDADYVEGIFQYEVDEGEAVLFGLTDSSYSGTVDIPSTLGGYPVTSIGVGAFSNCSNIQSVTIPSSVTWINEGGFSRCYGLKSITIPVSVKSIHEGAFYECSNLKDIYYAGTEQQKDAIKINAGNQRLLNAAWHYYNQEPTTSKPLLNSTTAESGSAQSQNDNIGETSETSKNLTTTERTPIDSQDTSTKETPDLPSKIEDGETDIKPETQDDEKDEVTESKKDSTEGGSNKTAIIILILVICLLASVSVIIVLFIKKNPPLENGKR